MVWTCFEGTIAMVISHLLSTCHRRPRLLWASTTRTTAAATDMCSPPTSLSASLSLSPLLNRRHFTAKRDTPTNRSNRACYHLACPAWVGSRASITTTGKRSFLVEMLVTGITRRPSPSPLAESRAKDMFLLPGGPSAIQPPLRLAHPAHVVPRKL